MIHDVADVLIYERIPVEALVSVKPKTLLPRTSQYLTQPLNQTPFSPSTPPQCWHVVCVAFYEELDGMMNVLNVHTVGFCSRHDIDNPLLHTLFGLAC